MVNAIRLMGLISIFLVFGFMISLSVEVAWTLWRRSRDG